MNTSRKKTISQTAFRFVVFFLAFFIISLMLWLKKEFGKVSFDQVLYHLQFGSEGILTADKSMINAFFNKCILTPSILALLFTLMNNNIFNLIKNIYLYLKEKISSLCHRLRIAQKIPSIPLHFSILIFAIIFASHKLSIFSYIVDNISPNKVDFYATQYISPSSVKLDVKNPKNLVLIYIESLESTYSDLSVFEEDFIQNVSTEALNGISFNKQRQAAGTSWTMAGIVSTQCGIPLKAPLGGGGERRRNQATELTPDFLPNTTCLGDILKERNYHNVFMGGASLQFAGKGNFFKTHHYDEIYGREEFVSLLGPKLPLNHWGLFDDDLLQMAKDKMDKLESGNQPYNLTVLTLDTHQPEGNLSKTCIGYGAVKFKDIVRCSARLVSDFVSYMDEKGYLENTTVVVLGDHLAMTNPMIKKLKKAEGRFVFNNYIAKHSKLIKNRDEITAVDHFPSILESMNIKIEGGKLGLGISGFTTMDVPDTKDRFELLDNYGTKASKTYMDFWKKVNNTD